MTKNTSRKNLLRVTAEETLKFLISQYGSFDGPLVYPIIVKETKENVGYVQLCPIYDGNREIGYHTEIAHDEGYKKCPEFWDKEYNEKYARLW